MVNVTVKCCRSEEETSGAIVIRSLEAAKMKLDLPAFQRCFSFLNTQHLCPRLLCYIQNGVCMDFIEDGTPLRYPFDREKLFDPRIRR